MRGYHFTWYNYFSFCCCCCWHIWMGQIDEEKVCFCRFSAGCFCTYKLVLITLYRRGIPSILCILEWSFELSHINSKERNTAESFVVVAIAIAKPKLIRRLNLIYFNDLDNLIFCPIPLEITEQIHGQLREIRKTHLFFVISYQNSGYLTKSIDKKKSFNYKNLFFFYKIECLIKLKSFSKLSPVNRIYL